jgi:hypothetical protein
LAHGVQLDDIDEFCRWLVVVARNVVIDAGRRSGRVVLLGSMPERVDAYDLARHVESRERLEHAGRVIAVMPPTERSALITSLTAGPLTPPALPRRESVKNAVRLHRARSRLKRALGAPAAWLGGVRQQQWLQGLQMTSGELIVAFVVSVPLVSGLGAAAHGAEAEPVAAPPVAASLEVSVGTLQAEPAVRTPKHVASPTRPVPTDIGPPAAPAGDDAPPRQQPEGEGRTRVRIDGPADTEVIVGAGTRIDTGPARGAIRVFVPAP